MMTESNRITDRTPFVNLPTHSRLSYVDERERHSVLMECGGKCIQNSNVACKNESIDIKMNIGDNIKESENENLDSCKDEGREGKLVKLFSVSRKQKAVLVLCSTARLFAACACSLIGPIYPIEAQKKGVNIEMVGFVFSVYGLVMFLSSFFLGKYTTRIGVKFLCLSGMFIGGSCTILFGFLDKGPSGTSFIVMSLVCRSVEAFGFACFQNALIIVTNQFHDCIGSALSIIQTFGTLGFMIGPAIGGFLYEVGSFGLPFYVMGSLLLLNAVILYLFLPQQEETKQSKKDKSIFRLMRSPMVVFPLFTTCFAIGGTLMFDALFSIHLAPCKVSKSVVGLLFLIAPLANVTLATPWGYISDVKDVQGALLVFGQMLFGLSYLIIGPSYLLPFIEFNLWTFSVGNVFLGIGFGILNVISIKCMLTGAYELNYDMTIETYALVSALYSTAYSSGQICGPVIGSAMAQRYGTSDTFTAFGLLNFFLASVMLIYFLRKFVNGRKRIGNCVSGFDTTRSNNAK